MARQRVRRSGQPSARCDLESSRYGSDERLLFHRRLEIGWDDVTKLGAELVVDTGVFTPGLSFQNTPHLSKTVIPGCQPGGRQEVGLGQAASLRSSDIGMLAHASIVVLPLLTGRPGYINPRVARHDSFLTLGEVIPTGLA